MLHERKIMKKWTPCFLVPVLFFLALGQVAAAPVFQIHETEHIFEAVPEGKKVNHSFVFRNEGDKELRILKVATSCGCTAASFTERLLPGEEGTIDVELDTLGYAGGDVIQAITLTTNDPENKNPVLQLRGPVTPFAVIRPAFIRLQGQAGTEIESGVEIHPDPEFPFRIESFHARDGRDFRFEIFSEEEGKRYHIQAKNIRTEPGRYYDLITLELDSPVRQSISIRVLGDIQAKEENP